MNPEIYIISGFLGSGKTTFIQKLIKEKFNNEKVVIIENDFGEESIDAKMLRSGGVEVKEINSGCICCTLSGDFVKSLKKVLEQFHPDKIIVEPSGVGKLSDVVKACLDPSMPDFSKIKKITVVDVKRCKTYLENFGEFFKDQIKSADTVLFSHVETYPDKVQDTYKLVKNLNPNLIVFSKPWSEISVDDILFHNDNPKNNEIHNKTHCNCHGNVDSNHDHSCCNHDHTAKDVFDTITLSTNNKFTPEFLEACINKLQSGLFGSVIRVKGIVNGFGEYINLQYVPDNLSMTSCSIAGNSICIIGKNLNKKELTMLFKGR